MSDPLRSPRKLLRASDEVMAGIEQQVRPRVSLRRAITFAATSAFVFAGVLAFVVFAITTLVVPSTTNGAGLGTVGLWALLFAVLIAIAALVQALGWRGARPDLTDPGRSIARTALRIAVDVLLTAACAWLVLASQGLSAGQVAFLTIGLVVVLHLVPMIVARLLRRGRQGHQASPSDPVP